MKDELQYWRDLAVAVYEEYRCELEEKKKYCGEKNENIIDEMIKREMECKFGISEEEDTALLTTKPEDAYEAYRSANMLHVYHVSFRVPSYTGSICIKAESEDDAEEYVRANMTWNEPSVDMCDDADVTDGPEIDGYYGDEEIEIDDVYDDGEYEED